MGSVDGVREVEEVEGSWRVLSRDGDGEGCFGPGAGRPGCCAVDGLSGGRMGCVDGEIEGWGKKGQVWR